MKKYAQELNLDKTEFDQCLDSNETIDRVNQDISAGKDLSVNGTPTLFINGKEYKGVGAYEDLKKEIDEALK